MTAYRLGLNTLLCCLTFFSICYAGNRISDKLNVYLYEDTKKLVVFVEDAAGMMERSGTDAFKEFSRKGSRWFNGDDYLFVYDLNGNCKFHPMAPELVGKNLINFKDIHGKPVIDLIAQIGKGPQKDAGAWVFYLWEEGTQLSPSWKSSYVRKVVGPDSKTYVIGSGSYNIKVEKVFVQENVNAAARLLQEKGKETAFAVFKDAGSPFSILGTFIFVLDEKGYTLVDPSYPTNTGRNLSGFKDAVGRNIVSEVMEKLRKNDAAWVQFLWPKPGSMLPSRKLLYVRKVRLGSETLIVGSSFFAATPIWMK